MSLLQRWEHEEGSLCESPCGEFTITCMVLHILTVLTQLLLSIAVLGTQLTPKLAPDERGAIRRLLAQAVVTVFGV